MEVTEAASHSQLPSPSPAPHSLNADVAISLGPSPVVEPAAQRPSRDVEPVAVSQPPRTVVPSRRRRLVPRRRRWMPTPQAQRRTRGRLSHTSQLLLSSDAAYREFQREKWERERRERERREIEFEMERERRERERREIEFEMERERRARERWDREIAFEAERNAFKERQLALMKRELALTEEWQRIANRFLDMAEKYFNITNNRN